MPEAQSIPESTLVKKNPWAAMGNAVSHHVLYHTYTLIKLFDIIIIMIQL